MARRHAARAERTNVFENRASEYSSAATEESWDEVWAEVDGAWHSRDNAGATGWAKPDFAIFDWASGVYPDPAP